MDKQGHCANAAAIGFALILACVAPFAAMARSQAQQQPRVVYDVPYVKAGDVGGPRRQTLDLYLPAGTTPRPPLVAFVHGGFWTLADDDYRIGPSLADALVSEGIAVALIRYRLAPEFRHPAAARDVAAAAAYLIRESDRYAYDVKRIYLAGHSAGAHLAALVALDSGFLERHLVSPRSLAGVIAISGVYNLRPEWLTSGDQQRATALAFGDDPAILESASPLTHVRDDAPPFLILGASSDFPGFLQDAREFADALREAGHRRVEQFSIPGRDHFSMVRLTNEHDEVRSLLLDFLNVDPLPPELEILIRAKRDWLNAPFSTSPFWRHESLIRPYPVDARFVRSLVLIYSTVRHELLELPLERYHVIDLFAYLDALPRSEVGRGDYLIVTNIYNEKLFWRRKDIEPYGPAIVVGIDDQRNLFRLGVFFRAFREYSWKPGPRPPMMARPLGAFIYFLKEPPEELRPQSAYYALTPDSFRLVGEDPLASLRGLPRDIYDVLTYRNGCVYCHSFRGAGSRSHHIVASTGAPHGGYALPLEEYPPEVFRAFLFNQHEVARKLGASANVVEEGMRQKLYDLVVEGRGRRRQER